MPETLVAATRGLSFSLGGRRVLHDVGLAVPEAAIYGFLGPNGAGKTTTLRLLLGLLPPPAGTVHLFGHELRHHRAALLGRVGALIENPSIYAHLTGLENVEATRLLHGLPRARTAAVLATVGLTTDANRLAGHYSLGMRQRLGLALALLPDPALLILDEPTNGLDTGGITEMRALLQHLRRDYGKTIIISSHLISEIERVATHVGIIERGRLCFQGSIEALQRMQETSARLVLHTADAAACRRLLPEFTETALPIPDAETLVLPRLSRQQVASVVERLVAAGQPIYQLHYQQPSLEDIFLQLTTPFAA